MKISAINFNNFKIQNVKQNKALNQTNSIQKQNLLMPSTAQYLAFMGGYSLDLSQTFKNLEDDQYPQDVQGMVLDELGKGNPDDKTLCDVHFEKYKYVLDCFTLDELKENYPEFEDVKSAWEISANPDSFIGKFQNGENEVFQTNEDLTLQLIKLYWGQGFSLNDLSKYIAQNSPERKDINLYYALTRLNIPMMNSRYASVLKLSNKKYNEDFTNRMSERLREAKEFKKQQQEGEPVYIPRGPLSESHRKHISEGLIKHYQENPQKLYEMSQRQKEFYRLHPELLEELEAIGSYAFHNTPEGISLSKHISKFARKYNKSMITQEELSGKKPMDTKSKSALAAFWEKNKWANKQLSIAMTKAREAIKTEKKSVEEIYNYKTIPDKQIVIDLIPKKVRKGMEEWISNQGYDLRDFVFCKAMLYKEDKENKNQIDKLQQLVNEKSQKLVDRYNNAHPILNDMIATALQQAIIKIIADLENTNRALPEAIRNDETKLLALKLIFQQHLSAKPIYREYKGDYYPIIGVDITDLTMLYVNFINYAYLMGFEEFAQYAEEKFNKCFEIIHKENSIKLN